VREELPSARPQRREHPTATQQLEPQPIVAEPLGHVAAVDEEQFEHALGARSADGERTRVEPPHDPASNVEDDDDADPQPQPDATHSQRPRRQEHNGRVVPGSSPPAGRRGDAERRLRAWRDAEPARPQAEPGDSAGSRPYPWLALKRAREAGPRDIDTQGPPPRIPHGDDGG
jgi:hypothetical protein